MSSDAANARPGPAEIRTRAATLRTAGTPCHWCPRHCGVDRLGGAQGSCGAGRGIRVASADLHFGEEPHFVGHGGSGTIFFSCCNLGCVFCQNYDISHGRAGTEIDETGLAQIMVELERGGAENINLVTPSHYPAGILAALGLARERGLKLPMVFNTSSYDAVDTLRMFSGVVDIYMPDFKFGSDATGAQLTQVSDYTTVAVSALREMVHQVGPSLVVRRGVAVAGISLRHLVLPGYYEDSKRCMEQVAAISTEITVNVMSQFRPAYRSHTVPQLNERLDWEEYRGVVEHARLLGLRNLLLQA